MDLELGGRAFGFVPTHATLAGIDVLPDRGTGHHKLVSGKIILTFNMYLVVYARSFVFLCFP